MTDSTAQKRCPKCQALNLIAELPLRDYRCGDCGLELAHLDLTIHGTIRGITGWLLDVDTLVNDRYRIDSVLGKGGFGVTYLVNDLRLHHKRRALKEIPEALFDEHETRLLGRLSHPAIPDITDRFSEQGMVYLVLEFGGNRTLRIEQAQRGGRIPLFVLLPWMRQLCDVLHYLHEQTPPIIHRDLKPDNVLLDENGRIMLIDFGIAKDSTPDTATRTLGRAASQGFSPPEQVLGTGTDARSDVYALGAILYNLLTNTMPPAAHERVIGKTIVPLSQILPEIPPLLDAAVMKALELNINLRQQSIHELAQTLDLVQSGGADTATVLVAGMTETLRPSQPGAAVHLPSVQIPSSRSSAGLAAASMRLDQPLASPEPSNRPWIAILAGISIPTLLAVAGFWYWQQQQDVSSQVAETPPVSKEAQPPQQDAPADQTAGQRTAGDDARPPPVEDAPTDLTPASASTAAAGVAATAATAAAAQAALNARSETAAPASPQTAPATASFQPSAALPSIFSSEQPASSTPARPAGGGSLLDVFEQQRATQAPDSTQPVPVTAQPVPVTAQPLTPDRPAPLPMPVSPPKPLTVEQPRPAKPATTSRTTTTPKPAKPKTTATTTRKPSTQAKSSSASSASSWGFQYKGAEKKD
ncbi:serine/threonine protein kinase [Thiobaca trueperi]|nr:serine/threonine-protein kinase [Thiobaca trueperi]